MKKLLLQPLLILFLSLPYYLFAAEKSSPSPESKEVADATESLTQLTIEKKIDRKNLITAERLISALEEHYKKQNANNTL